MPVTQGTRKQQAFRKEHMEGTSQTRTLTRDLGLSKLVTASVTFGSGNATAANGTFANFAAGDDILVEGANLNNGYFTTTAIDGVNQSFLTLDPPPKAEGPITVTIRTP